MAIKFITNTAWRDAAKVLVHNNASLTELSADAPNLKNVVGGPRWLNWVSSDNALKRITYINSAGGQSADSFILVGAHQHSGKILTLYSWPDPYPTAEASIVSFNPFNSTLIGPSNQDFFYDLGSLTGKYAFTAEFSDTGYAKIVNGLVFGQSISLNNPDKPVYAPIWQSITLGRNTYQVDHEAEWIFTKVTRSEVNQIETAYNKLLEPVFFYDSTGYFIPDYLWHGIITELSVVSTFDDLHAVKIRTARLRHY